VLGSCGFSNSGLIACMILQDNFFFMIVMDLRNSEGIDDNI
jgi:hypothetical protein